jgi:hypothetical protein
MIRKKDSDKAEAIPLINNTNFVLDEGDCPPIEAYEPFRLDGAIPGIVIANKNGLTYKIQGNGVSCSQFKIKGFYVPIPSFNYRFKSILFNPKFWYDVYHPRARQSEFYDSSRAISEYEFIAGEINDYLEMLTEWFNHKNNWDKAGNKLPNKRYNIVRDFKAKAYESFVPLKGTFDDKKFQGIMTWQNCD